MRSLNTSLPKTRKRQPTPDTHQSFRNAALTLTNLYKAALADIDRARSDGYQEALEHLVSFLDKENLGVGDGEGWRIRQWAMERLDGALPGPSTSDSDEETPEDQRARSSSPIVEHNPDDARPVRHATETAHRSDSAPPTAPGPPSSDADMSSFPAMFHFSSATAYPNSAVNDHGAYDFAAAARRAFPASRRPSHRSSSRNLQRSVTQNLLSLGSGAGQKRKLVNDVFNVDLNNDRREGPGSGPKRGRMA